MVFSKRRAEEENIRSFLTNFIVFGIIFRELTYYIIDTFYLR